MDENEDKQILSEESLSTNAKIKVIGVGGGGSNAVNQMIKNKSDEVDYWVLNTDCQALSNSPCENKYVLGKTTTKGLGAGGNPLRGKEAANESYSDLQLLVKGSDLVFIAAGEGGGTGTGAAPIIAKAAKEEGCLVLAIVTRPFNFEGKARRLNALEGINELKKNVDALIVVSNDKLIFNNGSMPLKNAFSSSDEVLAQSVKTITDLILVHGLINLDFADVKATLQDKGISLIGIGMGEGKDAAMKAAQSAINSQLLEASIKGAKSMIINVTIGSSTTLDEIQYAINYVTEAANGNDNDVNIIFGVQIDDTFSDKVKFAIIATDFSKEIDFSVSEPLINKVHHQSGDETLKPEASLAEKEIQSQKNSSPLPDYLREIYSNGNDDNASEEKPDLSTPLDDTKTNDGDKTDSTKPISRDYEIN
ncbi:MAG: cell division protein FtsZ [Bacilli bacterium]